MQTIQLAVTITAATALARGSVRYGDAAISLDDAGLQCIPPEFRARLWILPCGDFGVRVGPHTDTNGTVWTYSQVVRPEVDELSVASWLKVVAELVAAETEYAAKLEADIVAALALPDEAWIMEHFESRKPALNERQPAAADKDARVIARIEAVKSGELARRHAAWKAACDAVRAANAAEARERAARRAAFLSAVRRAAPERWLEHDRAVAEGYEASPTPMIIAVLRTIVESFVSRLPEGVYLREVIPYDATERTSPSAAALDLRAAVAAIADEQNAGISPELGQWVVSRVLRADVAQERDHTKKATVVRAEFQPADEERVPTRSILVSLEDLSEPDEPDEPDED